MPHTQDADVNGVKARTSAVGIVPRATIQPPRPPLPKRFPGAVLAALQCHAPG